MFFMVLLLIAALLEPIIEQFELPASIFLVLLGYISSEIATKNFGIDIGINWENFQPIIIHFILPVLIFQAAIMTDIRSLRENALPIFMLALPLLLISTAVIAAGVYFGINHPNGFPWIAALLTGAILSATDPSAILMVLRNHGVSERIILLLETEGLFSDATTIVLFSIVIGIALTGGETQNQWMHAAIEFLSVFFGGIATGVMTGIAAHFIIRSRDSDYLHILTTIITAYVSFILAQDYFNLSGVMAVLAAGLTIRTLGKQDHDNASRKYTDKFWGITAKLSDNLIFLLAGVTITLSIFTDQWLAILTGIVACLIARTLVIFSTFPVLNLVSGQAPVTTTQQFILAWGGVRGTITLALALSLPLRLGYWYTVQSIAYGVVLFTLFVQAASMRLWIKRLKLGNQQN